MSRSLATLTALALALTAVPALADFGHVLEEGHGHVHWDEVLILSGTAAVVVGLGLARLVRHRRRQA